MHSLLFSSAGVKPEIWEPPPSIFFALLYRKFYDLPHPSLARTATKAASNHHLPLLQSPSPKGRSCLVSKQGKTRGDCLNVGQGCAHICSKETAFWTCCIFGSSCCGGSGGCWSSIGPVLLCPMFFLATSGLSWGFPPFCELSLWAPMTVALGSGSSHCWCWMGEPWQPSPCQSGFWTLTVKHLLPMWWWTLARIGIWFWQSPLKSLVCQCRPHPSLVPFFAIHGTPADRLPP